MADNECKLKRMKLGVLVAAGLASATFLSACGARNPESAINSYLECMKENDTEGIADYIYQESDSSEEGASMVLETGYAVFDNYLKDYIQEKAGDIEFEVLESDTEDDMSEVSVEVTYTDARDAFNLALGDTYAEMYLSALMGVDMTDDEMEEALQSYFEEELESTGVETVTKTISIYCVKDGGSWKVIENGNLINVYTCNMFQAMQEFNEDTVEVETIDIVYGIYTRTDDDGNTITAEVGTYSDTGEDYIQIEAVNEAGEEILFVSCVANPDSDVEWYKFNNSDDFWDGVVSDYVGLTVDFYEGYMTVKLADSSELGDDYSEDVYDIINGDYLYEGELTEERERVAGTDTDTEDSGTEEEDVSDETVEESSAGDIDYAQVYDYAFGEINEDVEYGYYCLWDLNKDGIYELILGHGESSADYVNDVWTVGDDGGILGVGSFYGDTMFYEAPDGNGIYSVYGHMDYQTITRITMVDGEVVEEIISDGELGEGEDYYSNEMEIYLADISDKSLLEQY